MGSNLKLSKKQSLKIITFSDLNSSSTQLFLRFKVLPFFDFVKFLNIIFMYNVLNLHLPSSICETFKISSLTVNARNNRYPSRLKPGILRLPKVYTTHFGNHSIRYQAILSWNLLQNFSTFNNISDISLSQLKQLSKMYFLSLLA